MAETQATATQELTMAMLIRKNEKNLLERALCN